MKREPKKFDVSIRSMNELRTPAGVLAKEVYFEGGDVLRCYEGRFRFTLENRKPVEIGPCEALVVYPDQRVTIEAMGKENRLLYAIFEGQDVADYFSHFGFFNGLHGRTSEQMIPFESVKTAVEAGENLDNPEVHSQMNDALVTYAHDFRDNAGALVFDAVRQIRANLADRIVQLKPLCEQLKVSRAYLHRVFVQAGVGSPSELIRREQMRLILRLLKDNTLSLAEIADQTGFLSQTHFSDFVHRHTGRAPRDLRH